MRVFFKFVLEFFMLNEHTCKKKNILYITHSSLSDPRRGTPIRMRHIALQLARANRLIVCASDVDSIDGFEFIKYPSHITGLNKLKFFVEAVKHNHVDIVITSTETNIKLPILIKLFTGVRIAIDLHGIYAEELLYAGKISRTKALLYGFLVRIYLRMYDMVFPVSEKLGQYYGSWIKKYHVVYGGVDSKDLESASLVPIQVDQNKLVIGYMGNSREYQGLSALLEVVAILERKYSGRIKINLVLTGVTDVDVCLLLDQFNIRDLCTYVLDVPHNEVKRYIVKSTVLVIPRLSVTMTEYAYPSKLPEYLAVGVPVVVTDVGPVKELLTLSPNCVPMLVTSTQNMIENLLIILESCMTMSQGEKSNLIRCANKLVKEQLSWDNIGSKMNRALTDYL